MMQRRRILFSAAAFFAVLVALLGSVRWNLPQEPVRIRLEKALARDTGYRLVSMGEAAFTAFPWPILQVTNLQLAKGGGSAEAASVPLAKARLNIASWLSGDPRITELSLFEPRIALVSAERMEETEAVATVVTNYLRRENRPALISLRVQSAEVTLDGQRWLTGLAVNVSNIAGNDLRVAAAGAYRGQPLKLQAVVSPFAGPTLRPITWELEVGDLAATFSGMLVSPPSLDAEGRISIALGAGALRSRPVSLSREAAGLLDGVSIRGSGRLALPQLVLRDAVIERGPHRLSGAIDLTLSTTAPRMSATLHAERLDLTPLLKEVAAYYERSGSSGTPLATAWMRLGHADLRFSARQLSAWSARLDDAAFSAKLGGGRFEVALSEGRISGGSAKGRLALADQGSGLEVRTSGILDGVDLGHLLFPNGAPTTAGVATGHWLVESAGRNVGDILRRGGGRGQVIVRNGEFSGFDVDRFLRRQDVAPAATAEARTRFQSVELGWRMDSGVLRLADGKVRGTTWQGAVEGVADIGAGRLDLLARMALDSPAQRREERTLLIRGPMTFPELLPAGPTGEKRSNMIILRQPG